MDTLKQYLQYELTHTFNIYTGWGKINNLREKCQKKENIIKHNTERRTQKGKERQKGNPYNYKAVKARIIMTDVD